jgi:hypothetical protein
MNPAIFVSVTTEAGVPSAERKSVRYDQFVANLLKPLPENLNACHIAMGLAGELGELCEDDSDKVEEFGDYEFYLQAALNHYGLTLAECYPTNFVKTFSPEEFVYWTGQLVDCVKREYIYNKPRELERIKECIGTVSVYLQDTYTDMGITRQAVLQFNAIKLEERYANLMYSDEAAIARADKPAGE